MDGIAMWSCGLSHRQHPAKRGSWAPRLHPHIAVRSPVTLTWCSSAPACGRPLRRRVRGRFNAEIFINRHLVHWKASYVMHSVHELH